MILVCEAVLDNLVLLKVIFYFGPYKSIPFGDYFFSFFLGSLKNLRQDDT